MCRVSIIVPAYNVEKTLPETLRSLLAQTFRDFEIIVVNDGATDNTLALAESFASDPRLCSFYNEADGRMADKSGRSAEPCIRIVSQTNRGLAGARNTGIEAARGAFVGFCDADDLWLPEKLAAHVAHLDENPKVGISFSGSAMIDDDSRATGHRMTPKLQGITARDIFKRNPIGNGSAPVFRAATLQSLAYWPEGETERAWVFDETFRQSEDIECWLRLVLTTDWIVEGVDGDLTLYRVNGDGLSAATDRQYAAWERMVGKLRPLAPEFFAANERSARAYQLRYLARRAVSARDGKKAVSLAWQSVVCSPRCLMEEPRKTVVTLAAATTLGLFGASAIDAGEATYKKLVRAA